VNRTSAVRSRIDEKRADSFTTDRPMNTIVINNQKGGVGKTTLAVHLAWFMAEAGHRVLMIDVDAQGNATDTLKHHAGPTRRPISSGQKRGLSLAMASRWPRPTAP
jgi:cellulose biosynthesis protein BcsQ